MPAASKRQLRTLQPYLEGDKENNIGEWGLYCPFHEDPSRSTRSASVNIRTGVWYCMVCEIGGSLNDLVEKIKDIQSEEPVEPKAGKKEKNVAEFLDYEPIDGDEYLTDPMVIKMHRALGRNKKALAALTSRRGLTIETLKKFQIGWDEHQNAYTIPVRDRSGVLVNVRFYQLDPAPGRRKIWGVTGHNDPVLYPISILDDNSEVGIVEGEWDSLISIQNGFPAVTRTGSSKVWKPTWNVHFDDKQVWVCQDCDKDGQIGARKIMVSLKRHAREIRNIILPYEIELKHGKDISDYYVVDGFTAQDFKDLLGSIEGEMRDPTLTAKELVDVSVLDSFNAESSGRKLRMRVTVTGKRTPPYLLPKEVDYSCTQSAGAKCQICPMNEANGSAQRHVSGDDPVNLEMMGATAKQVGDLLRNYIGAQKCGLLTINTTEFRSVEELYVRPSIDVQVEEGHQHTNRRIVSVGRHDTLPNNTVEIVGTIYPSPRGQHNEFQAWEVAPTQTSLDVFKVTKESRNLLSRFRPQAGQSPLAKVAEISKELSLHVTKIYGRPEMHALMDLVFHSALTFNFGDQVIERGWMDALIIGDTRTGKSEAATKLVRHYGLGEIISCESASFAGVVGGLQQIGNKEWEVTWGAIPLNDRRAVVMDEVSGLTPEQIAQMSSIRSSGEAQITKIRSERTFARTRLLWLGNPRNGRMADYTYGVQAIRPLVGNNEDIARFDMAMAVKADEVDPADINVARNDTEERKYTSEACHELLLWVWSRGRYHILWGPGAIDSVYAAALDLGKRYTENPPLLQAANARVKVARIAVAIAARTYSTDRTGECILVKKAHVSDAVRFIDLIYGLHSFGYKELSEEYMADLKEASQARDATKQYLASHIGLSKFLRSMVGQFRTQDMQDMLNMSREEANGVVGSLWKFRMITRQGPNIRINPVLHELLREIKE